MQVRLEPSEVVPELFQAMLDLSQRATHAGLEPSLVRLVKTRASQLNGCARCLHMHTREARQAGESEERLYLLSAWRESPLYSDRERAALAWTEALTRLEGSAVPDELYDALAGAFSERERVTLTFVVIAINGWNRLAAAFRLSHPASPGRAAA
jgi:AhpD family alkylhydroperoxidase